MTKRLWTRGLPVLLLVALVSIGCSSSQPPPTEPPPDDNICGWPDYCHPDSARQMLQIISGLVEAAENKGQIDQTLAGRVDAAIDRCRHPDLRNVAGRHVCHLQGPKPCDELSGIKQRAEDEAYPKDPKGNPASPQKHWETIATELENFPTGK